MFSIASGTRTGWQPAGTLSRKTRAGGISMLDIPKKRILLIGDSISIGYTPFVAAMLKDKADVQRPDANCGSTVLGLRQIDAWLGNKKWDVIHFNFGLHDLRRMDEEGNFDPDAKGERQVSLSEYEKNLMELVCCLKETGARLIWCSTTPVPDGCQWRVSGDEKNYNEVALKVMTAENIQVNDLHAAVLQELAKFQNPNDVHFNEEGYEFLARVVVRAINAEDNNCNPHEEAK